MHDSLLVQILILLTASIVASLVFRRIKVPPTVAYISVGLIAGPYAMGWVEDAKFIHFIAEFGVVFLLFTLGLEFSLPKIMAMGRKVLILGSSQVIICGGFAFGLSLFFGLPPATSFVIAGALALSSTAVISKELTTRNEINQPHGKLAIATLLFQDVAAVIFLISIPAFVSVDGSSFASTFAFTLVKGIMLFLLLSFVGKWILPRLFDEVAKFHSDEIFVLTALFIALMAAGLTHYFGLSMALGAFIAGMLLGESHYRHQVTADIRPFRDLLLGLFFIGIGMMLNIEFIQEKWAWVLFSTFILVGGKALLIIMLTLLIGKPKPIAFKTGLYLAQGGEFGFAMIALSQKHELLDQNLGSIMITTIVLSIAITPALIQLSHYLANRFPSDRRQPGRFMSKEQIQEQSEDLHDHAILCGYGRVGHTIARFLEKQGLDYVALDSDAATVNEARAAGYPVYYGDGRRLDLIRALGLSRAKLLVICFNEPICAAKLIENIRSTGVTTEIMVRTSDDKSLRQLEEMGATEIVPEKLEASLMMVVHALRLMGVSDKAIENEMKEARRNRYELLHSFFQTETGFAQIDIEPSDDEDLSHAVTITEKAYACNQLLNMLNLERFKVQLVDIRLANGKTISPTPTYELQASDTLILKGSVSQIEDAEAFLLTGQYKL